MLGERLIILTIVVVAILTGPCYTAPTPKKVSVSDIITPAFFDAIINKAENSCAGKKFYTRSAFLKATVSFPSFGSDGSSETIKREMAAFFAHLTRETGHFCFLEEIDGASINYCDNTNKENPCARGKKYHGRGPIQLTWNFNYGPAGKSIGFDGLNNPEIVSKDPVIAFKTALWHWTEFVHSVIVSGKGFGETIRAINGALECNGGNQAAVTERIQHYKLYCDSLGISYGSDLSC